MRRTVGRVIAAFLVLGLPAEASAAIKITKIYYDSPGSDTGSNTSLNHEYVVIKNTGTAKVALTGWTLRDLANHVFKFPTFKLAPGSLVTVHTGKGANTLHSLYWRSGAYIWNNDGDTAKLRRRNGTLADTCSYSGGSPGYKLC
jgi:Lamin Tail Domain